MNPEVQAPQPTPPDTTQPTVPPQPVPPMPPQAQPQPPSPDNSSKGKWIVFSITFAIIILFIFFSLFSISYTNKSSDSPTNSQNSSASIDPISPEAKKLTDQFVNDIQANNPQAIYAAASEDFTSTVPESAFSEGIAKVAPAYASGEEKFTGNQKITTSDATYMVMLYTVSTPNQDIYLRFVLKDNNGTWQLFNMDYSTKPLGELTSQDLSGVTTN